MRVACASLVLLEPVFWIASLLLAWVYVGYPLFMAGLARGRERLVDEPRRKAPLVAKP